MDSPARAANCAVRIDGTAVGLPVIAGVDDLDGGTALTVSQGGVVSPGVRTVSLACRTAQAGVSETLLFDSGGLTAIATAP